ncbi:MAG: hypothetical protein P8Y85_07230 [Nitrospirota bacterium]
MSLRYLLFGQYLARKGLITEREIIAARMMQKKTNKRIGRLARERGMMGKDDVAMILALQEHDPDRKFIELAVEQEMLSPEDVERLLREQEDSHLFFGEALVKLGSLTREELQRELAEFDEAKEKSHLE